MLKNKPNFDTFPESMLVSQLTFRPTLVHDILPLGNILGELKMFNSSNKMFDLQQFTKMPWLI